jgi:hypothetical protein
MRPYTIAAAIICGCASQAFAASESGKIVVGAAAVHVCAEVKDDKERLACFDKAAKLLNNVFEEDAAAKDTPPDFAPSDYKPVDAEDLYISPTKYVGKPVELSGARCLYADVNEYRCGGRSHLAVVVFAKDVGPAQAKAEVEDKCGSVKQIETAACRKTIRFVVKDVSEDALSGMTKRLVILTDKIEIVTKPSGRR